MARAFKILLFAFFLLKLSAVRCQAPVRYAVTFGAGNTIRSAAANISLNDITQIVTAAPNISYQTPQTYIINNAINALSPFNAGGAVPATIYGQVSTFAGSNNISYFSTVTGVATDAAGYVYVADWGQNQIKKISPTGAISLFAGSINGSQGAANGLGTAASFYSPDALAFDNAGNLIVSDQQNHLIRKITPAGLVSTLAGSGISGTTDGTGTAASFNNPRGMTITAAGDIYVADQGNNLVRKITAAGVVTTFAGSGAGGFTNGQGITASFNTPTSVASDAAGNLYVSDAGNNAIRKISPAGVVSTFATGLNFPRELRVDGTGNLYVAEQNNGAIDRISPSGLVTRIVSGFYGPRGLVLDGNGNMFVGDEGTIKKVIISGYTIDKTLPAGLTFDPLTGIISGTPTALSPATDYTITAYNGGGSSTAVVNIAVALTAPLKPSVITLPPQQPGLLDPSNNYDPKATSTNNETPITYTSSNTAVATITPDGLIHVIAPGVTTITAYQNGDANYSPASPVSQVLTVVEYLAVNLPPIDVKTVCDADFNADAESDETKIPITYSSSNTSVATVSGLGMIHINGIGTTTITAYQNADPPLYKSATPQTQTLTVTPPLIPAVTVAAVYASPCLGSAVTFTAIGQNGGANPTYQWQVNNVNTGTNTPIFTSSTLLDGDKVNCVFTNTDNACLSSYVATSNTVAVSLITPSTPSVSIAASVNYVFKGKPITFTATVKNANGTVNYQWYVNGQPVGANYPVFVSNSFSNNDLVSCTISPDAACSTPATSQTLTVKIVTKIEIPNTFTPNNDGYNDVWDIFGIANYPNCLVNIYNRYGTLVYQSRGYNTPWNGTANNAPVPSATYYYFIDLGSENKTLSGYITVIR